MRLLLAAGFVALLASVAPPAHGDPPTTLVVRNVGRQPTRVQIAIGDTLPCDSSDDHLVLDVTLEPGESRVLGVDAVKACARSTAPGSSIDWRPPAWIYGGFKCRRHVACWPDPSVVMRF